MIEEIKSEQHSGSKKQKIEPFGSPQSLDSGPQSPDNENPNIMQPSGGKANSTNEPQKFNFFILYRNSVPVEERLQKYLNKYQSKKDQLAKEILQTENAEIKAPQINEVSERIVANMPRITKVEDRLLVNAQISKLAKEQKLKEADEEAKKLYKPEISDTSRLIAQLKNENDDVVQRLYDYQKVHEEKQKELQKQVLERENCTFAPQINSQLNSEILSKRSEKSVTNLTKSKIEAETYSFKPQISKNSAKIAEKLVFFNFVDF